MIPPLHDYQDASVTAIRQAFERSRRVLYCLPTGGGKTRVAAEVAAIEQAHGGRVLVLTHTDEIYRQCTERVTGATVAMVQTLDSRIRRGKPLDVGEPTLVIADEFHHSPSDSWRRVLARFPAARILGLTATPWGVTDVDEVIVGAYPSQLVASGYLPRQEVYAHGEPDLSRVRIRGGEYVTEQLARATNVRELRGDVLKTYQKRTPGLPFFGFACNRAHAQALTDDFQAAGIPCAYLDGESKDRREVIERFTRGEISGIWNCDLLGEGVDIPGARVCIMARPLHSLRAYLQQAGRARAAGHPVAHIHDHGGNLQRHGHPQKDRDYSPGADVRPPKAVYRRECPACTWLNTPGRKTCRNCGGEFPESTRVVAVVELDANGFEADPAPWDYGEEEVTERIAA